MSPSRLFLISLSLGVFATSGFALDESLFHHTDSLAQRDEWGLLTQGPLNPTDFERRYPWRFIYYPISGRELSADTAYVGALQTALRRKGYYSGPIDGAFSDEVAAAICRLQKAHAMRVNGRLTVPVRRALYLP
jgi:Putative peptidoglycan binding domain